jgi:hypothetical protein
MSTRLYHPESGGEFTAPDSAVPQWLRSGWVPLADWKAQQARELAASNGSPTPTTAGRSAGAEPKE